MILKSDSIADMLANTAKSKDPLIIKPQPDLDQLRTNGNGAIDLRLGTWFVTLRQSRSSVLRDDPTTDPQTFENRLAQKKYLPFGKEFILHPRAFILGVTMEWIRLPPKLAGYVVGKSSWGRRGLIIATAIGVHPGFSGCLTLELTNLGEVPIQIKPGVHICQLFLHRVDTDSETVSRSRFSGRRMPNLGFVKADEVANKLANGEI